MIVINDVLSRLPSREEVAGVLTIRNALILVGGWMVYQLLRAAWNLSPFHPLSRFPGPKLAAATYFPEFWYDCVMFGRYTHEIIKMHEIYGPMVRINPDEIHCSDFNFADSIFAAGGRKRDKPTHQTRGSPFEGSGFMTSPHDHHRLRRAPLNKYFSKPQLSQYEPQIREYAQRLCEKLLNGVRKGEPFLIQEAYSCFTSDVISDYCFGQSFGFLDRDGWEPNFRGPLYSLMNLTYLFRFYPILKHYLLAMPWFLDYLPTSMSLMIKTLRVDIPKVVKQTKANADAGIIEEKYPTIFMELLNSDLPASEKTAERIVGEAVTVLGGGTETVSWTLSVITYFLLAQPRTLARLADELGAAAPDPLRLPPWSELEKLAYLSAVVQEGLRLAYGVPGRTARVPTEEDLVYRGEWRGEKVEHVVPRGYAVGMSTVVVHHDESLFPDSYSFAPERWLDAEGGRRRDLDRCLMSFAKGTRICLGMNLAMCELFTMVATFALRVFPHMRLYETTEDDIRWDHDVIVTGVKSDSKGVRVILV